MIIYGFALGCMNLSFYGALKTIPLGWLWRSNSPGHCCSRIRFRRPIDFVWIALAVVGLLVLLPLSRSGKPLALEGIALALLAGGCWALYIIYGRRAGISHGGPSTALGMLVSSLFIVPDRPRAKRDRAAGAAHPARRLRRGPGLERAAVFAGNDRDAEDSDPYLGVLMSLDPVLGGMAGFALLHEHLSWLQSGAIGCIMVASAGSASAHRVDTLPD